MELLLLNILSDKGKLIYRLKIIYLSLVVYI